MGPILLFTYLYLPLLLQIIFLLINPNPNYLGTNLALLVIQAVTTLTLVLFHLPELKKEWQEYKDNGGQYFRQGFKYYITGYLISIFINMLITMIFQTTASVNETENRALIDTMAIYAIPTVAILAPIGEELAFRKGFRKMFKNPYLFAIITGLLFGFAHVYRDMSLANALYGFSYSALGIGLGYAYAKTDNIFTSISLHIFHNSLSLLLIFIAL